MIDRKELRALASENFGRPFAKHVVELLDELENKQSYSETLGELFKEKSDLLKANYMLRLEKDDWQRERSKLIEVLKASKKEFELSNAKYEGRESYDSNAHYQAWQDLKVKLEACADIEVLND